MTQFEYNVIPWGSDIPSKAGFYMGLLFNGTIVLTSIYPEKGNLIAELISPYAGRCSIGEMNGVKKWSPRITWEEVPHD